MQKATSVDIHGCSEFQQLRRAEHKLVASQNLQSQKR